MRNAIIVTSTVTTLEIVGVRKETERQDHLEEEILDLCHESEIEAEIIEERHPENTEEIVKIADAIEVDLTQEEDRADQEHHQGNRADQELRQGNKVNQDHLQGGDHQ